MDFSKQFQQACLMGRKIKQNLPKDLSDLLELIGANLRDMRTSRGITQAALAKNSKVSTTTVSDLESKCARDVRLSTLTALARVLDCDVARLLVVSDLNLTAKDQARLLKASEDILKIARKVRPHSDN
jgi:transcriptional regulator with XRE-family HTH domain